MDNQVKLIYKLMALSNKVKPFSSETKVVKLMEEVGELAAALVKINGYKTNDEKPEALQLELFKEICDVFIMIVSLGQEFGLPIETFETMIDEKLNKWYNVHIEKYITDQSDVPDEFEKKLFSDSILKYRKQKNEDWINKIFPNPNSTKPFIGDDLIEKKRPVEFNRIIEDVLFGKKELNQECLHQKCSECNGTGQRQDGSTCVHMISCPCPLHSPRC